MVVERYTYRRIGTAWIKFSYEGHEYDARWDAEGTLTVTTDDHLRLLSDHPAVLWIKLYHESMNKALERSMQPL